MVAKENAPGKRPRFFRGGHSVFGFLLFPGCPGLQGDCGLALDELPPSLRWPRQAGRAGELRRDVGQVGARGEARILERGCAPSVGDR